MLAGVFEFRYRVRILSVWDTDFLIRLCASQRGDDTDCSGDGRGKRTTSRGGGTGGDPLPKDALRALTPHESKVVRLRKRLNETRVFEYFFQKFGLTMRLRQPEIEGGVNCKFLSLEKQLLLQQMLVSNIFSP
jgi:hypothetical protein